MRRLCATFALVVLSLSVFPARAEAYFWAWLDDLSGPQFAGFLLEVQVMCKGKQVADSEHAILRLIESNELERIKYGARPREQYPSTAYPYLNSAQAYIKRSNDLLNYALNDLKPGQNATAIVVQALAWKRWASQQFAWAERLRRGGVDDPLRRPGSHDDNYRDFSISEEAERHGARYFIPAGVNLSVCDAQPLQRDNHFLRLNAGAAIDFKDDHEYGKNWMLSFGASYHKVLAPWITIGAGGGLARFFPSDEPSFWKAYLQPWIIDIRPGAWVKNADYRSAWRQFVYVRYGGLTFPQGFDPGQFHPRSPRYDAELVHTLGVHFDLSPILRARKGTW